MTELSSIDFPLSADFFGKSSQQRPILNVRPPHLPFRRISLPTHPSLLQRHSVVSVASFESLPEEGPFGFPSIFGFAESPTPSVEGGAVQNRSPLATSGLSPWQGRTRNERRKSVDSSCQDKDRNRGRSFHKRKGSSVVRSPSRSSGQAQEARVAKRRKVIQEFFDTEKSYVDGLDLIYSRFLSPIIASLDTSEPLLDRGTLTKLFSNFIDIWNLHQSFLNALTEHLSPMLPNAVASFSAVSSGSTSRASNDGVQTLAASPSLSPILLSHFPYLSLYTPFIVAFPSILSTLTDLTTFSRPNPHYSKNFAEFLVRQESDPRCGKLKFRDWMLTIVQRCPRYMLLLKDLRSCTKIDSESAEAGEAEEHERLGVALDLVLKITSSLDISLHAHTQSLSLIAIQASTSNLPFQLIVPGRTLLKRGSLYQLERRAPPRKREFLLFSDCLIWLAKGDGDTEWVWGRMIKNSFGNSVEDSSRNRRNFESHADPTHVRKSTSNSNGPGTSEEERWTYKGKLGVIDVEVVVSSEWGVEQRRFEILSPGGSFAMYAETEHERDSWVSMLRQAKVQLLASLNVMNPNSTLTSSSSTNHVRRSLQALPFPLTDARLATVNKRGADIHGDAGICVNEGIGKRKEGRRALTDGGGRASNQAILQSGERRAKVEHWIPAIWIPDERTKECMRCGRPFGWRRRRHHCRLCGRCVCATCSEKTFYIAELSTRDGLSKPARSCNICYETVFPLLDPSPDRDDEPPCNKDQTDQNTDDTGRRDHKTDTITSLSNFSAWLSSPSLPDSFTSAPQALMPARFDRRLEKAPQQASVQGNGKRARIRLRSQNSRPMSYMQVLEGFEESKTFGGERDVTVVAGGSDRAQADKSQEIKDPTSSGKSRPTSQLQVEDTVRRSKRFSLPAVALQPMSVTVQTMNASHESLPAASASTGANSMPTKDSSTTTGDGRVGLTKRFSLVLNARSEMSAGDGGWAVRRRQSEVDLRDMEMGRGRQSFVRSIVVGKLNDLLKNSRVNS
ncbi:hypothetical protein AX17_003599 [Amanita inopinata Kibby_2008]|nr:hypothetical protein AX17_003599 [Amanita inopinata Kibby_2008]